MPEPMKSGITRACQNRFWSKATTSRTRKPYPLSLPASAQATHRTSSGQARRKPVPTFSLRWTGTRLRRGSDCFRWCTGFYTTSLQLSARSRPAQTKPILDQKRIAVGMNISGSTEYAPPCPPLGQHEYVFRVYALDVDRIQPEANNKAGVMDAMKGHILTYGELVGLFGG